MLTGKKSNHAVSRISLHIAKSLTKCLFECISRSLRRCEVHGRETSDKGKGLINPNSTLFATLHLSPREPFSWGIGRSRGRFHLREVRHSRAVGDDACSCPALESICTVCADVWSVSVVWQPICTIGDPGSATGTPRMWSMCPHSVMDF